MFSVDFGSATGKCMFILSYASDISMFFTLKKSFSCRMEWWSVAGFSVLRQTVQRMHCLYTSMGPAARNADVSVKWVQ